MLSDILEYNDYQKLGEQRQRSLKTMLTGYKTMSGALRQQLQEMGFEITEVGKQYHLTYFGDSRYNTSMAKTGSDHREGKNIASEIINSMM